MATPPQPKRLYQVWKGSNRFFCGGRLIFGPEVGSISFSAFLITAPAVAFCSRVIPRIQDHFLWIPVLVVAVIVTVLDLIFLFLTSGRDPGIVPRNTRPAETDEAFDFSTPSMEWVQGRTPNLRLPRTKDVIVNDIVVKVKYCDTCLLYRAPRASHCSICDNCVQRFDHHCPWVGQCIGIRNYRFFFLFISSSTFLCIYVFTFSLLNILTHNKDGVSLKKTMSREVLSVILLIYCFIAVWFVGGLTIFHLYLISTNQTTYENFRYRYDKKENPHNKGILRNFKEVLFSKIPPSMNDFRSWVVEDLTDVEAVAPNMGGDSISSKDKIDIEMGSSKFGTDASLPIPEILKNLDYDGIDYNLKSEDENDESAFVPFFFPIDQERTESNRCCEKTIANHELRDSDEVCTTPPDDHEPRESNLCCTKENGAEVANGVDEGSTSNGTSPVNHENHIFQ